MKLARLKPAEHVIRETKKELETAIRLSKHATERELRLAMLRSIEKFPDKQNIIDKIDMVQQIGYLNTQERKYLLFVVSKVVRASIESEVINQF